MDTNIKKKAISYHYDVGNEFYKLWLDPRMVYSCALWADSDYKVELSKAQLDKLDWHIRNLKINDGGKILDIGCGWGALLKRFLDLNGKAHCVGLTLSKEQVSYVNAMYPDIDIRLENWFDFVPDSSFDGIVSIGALEHFANREMPTNLKLDLYKDFFYKCYSWLNTNSILSLQTIIYGSMKSEDQNLFISDEVFPNSELPTLTELESAFSHNFHFVDMRLDGKQYAKTCDIWLDNLRGNKNKIISSYGESIYLHYVKYLKLCVIGFHSGKIDLARIVLKRK